MRHEFSFPSPPQVLPRKSLFAVRVPFALMTRPKLEMFRPKAMLALSIRLLSGELPVSERSSDCTPFGIEFRLLSQQGKTCAPEPPRVG
jgi:hypothetical protein